MTRILPSVNSSVLFFSENVVYSPSCSGVCGTGGAGPLETSVIPLRFFHGVSNFKLYMDSFRSYINGNSIKQRSGNAIMKSSSTGRKLLFLFVSFPLLFFSAACGIDYRLNAVERARAYALKNTTDLSETDRNFIRYSDPEILSNLIFSSKVPEKEDFGTGPNRFDSYEVENNPNYDYMHTAFVWHLPKAGFSVLVDGAGERDLRGWDPDCVLYKKFIPENTALAAARIRAVTFLVNFFPELDFADINRVRFSEPMVLPTSFLLENPAEQTREKQMKKWMDYIRTGEGLKPEPVQISLAWTSPVNGDKIVVCGTAPGENLIGWTPRKALILKPKELDSAIAAQRKVEIRDPRNEKGEPIITPELNPRKTIQMQVPNRPKIRR